MSSELVLAEYCDFKPQREYDTVVRPAYHSFTRPLFDYGLRFGYYGKETWWPSLPLRGHFCCTFRPPEKEPNAFQPLPPRRRAFLRRNSHPNDSSARGYIDVCATRRLHQWTATAKLCRNPVNGFLEGWRASVAATLQSTTHIIPQNGWARSTNTREAPHRAGHRRSLILVDFVEETDARECASTRLDRITDPDLTICSPASSLALTTRARQFLISPIPASAGLLGIHDHLPAYPSMRRSQGSDLSNIESRLEVGPIALGERTLALKVREPHTGDQRFPSVCSTRAWVTGSTCSELLTVGSMAASVASPSRSDVDDVDQLFLSIILKPKHGCRHDLWHDGGRGVEHMLTQFHQSR
ncbi:hypothetical protein P171DRAFT_469546 [Karstenula rhodostoma CBS 690.94]|uniref:Uncharacterized protein n=1 Tax=Karstenula rhodostoma CBS 690.94 TaxID=1392251 RepID=A0A9P4PSC0_9PLEO|nr:hypothetical protein P171DRAFT_469546 [Karstenula rhodostoma CBS 690.94]